MRLHGRLVGHHASIAANLELSLAPTPTAPARARAAVADWLVQHYRNSGLFEVAQLLISELVTNAIRHASTSPEQLLHVRGWADDATVRLEVRDGGTEGTVGRRARESEEDPGGFGLELVARLASDWGVERDRHGTTVWLDLPAALEAPS